MLQLADRLTVPQVFFNDQHVGGADETLAVLAEWDGADGGGGALAQYQTLVADFPDPTDPRLQLPTTEPVEPAPPPPPRPDAHCLVLPDGVTEASVLAVTETLKRLLQPVIRNNQRHLTVYKQSFTGQQAVGVLMTAYKIDAAKAVAFGRQLLRANLWHNVVVGGAGGGTAAAGDFVGTGGTALYRLQCHHTPSVLNSYRSWTERVDPDIDGLGRRLSSLLAAVLAAATNPATGTVDYKRALSAAATAAGAMPDAASSPSPSPLAVFDEAVCELQRVDMFGMDEATRTAYAINVYNLMIQYAMVKVGVGTTTAARGRFFAGVQIQLSNHLFSFQDLENGVLRGNRRPPYGLAVPFGRRDPRLPLAIGGASLSSPSPDCRVHFALNCGAKSCPPVQFYTAEALTDELRIVALAFCEQDDHVRIDAETATLHVSTIFYWYRVDFAPSNALLPAKVLEYLRGEKKALLQGLIDASSQAKKAVTVKFLPYDWSIHASDYTPFDSSSLSPNETSLFKLSA